MPFSLHVKLTTVICLRFNKNFTFFVIILNLSKMFTIAVGVTFNLDRKQIVIDLYQASKVCFYLKYLFVFCFSIAYETFNLFSLHF